MTSKLPTHLALIAARLLQPALSKYWQECNGQLPTLLNISRGFLQKRLVQRWVLSQCPQHHSKVVLSGDQDVHVHAGVTHQVEAASELVELWSPIKNVSWESATNVRRVVQESADHLAVTSELLDRLEQGTVHHADKPFFPCGVSIVFGSGIFNLLLSLSPWNQDRNTDRYETADCLNPRGPLLNGEVWNGGLLAGERPRNQRSCTERHHRYDCPVSVGSSLLHDFPPSMDWILPLGVAA